MLNLSKVINFFLVLGFYFIEAKTFTKKYFNVVDITHTSSQTRDMFPFFFYSSTIIVMGNKIDKQTITNEIVSHWVPYILHY